MTVAYTDLFTKEVVEVKEVKTPQERFWSADYRRSGVSDIPCKLCRYEQYGGRRCTKVGGKKDSMRVAPMNSCNLAKGKASDAKKKVTC
jgi:hypothetical protein